MNKVTKFLVGAAIVAPALIASAAFAATFTNVQFQNGDVTVQGTGNSTVTATFRVVVPANETVEYIQTDVIGDNLGPVDTSVGGELGLQEGIYNVAVQIKLPPNTGTYTLNVQGAGKFGALRSINGSDNVVGSGSFGSALRVVADSSNTGSTSAPSGIPQSIWDKFLAWMAGSATPAPTTNANCAALTAKLPGTSYGVYNDANASLQGFLIANNPNSIPALKAGASFGFYGPQTQNAVSSYKAVNQCV